MPFRFMHESLGGPCNETFDIIAEHKWTAD